MNSESQSQVTGFSSFDVGLAGSYAGGAGVGTGVQFGPHMLGTRMETRDGRVFYMARMGAVAGAPGLVYQSSVPVPNHLAQTPAAAGIGATSVTITTLGATAATVNQYANGWMQVDTDPGGGRMYGIDSHLANAGSAALILNLAKDDAIQVALTTSSRVGLIANPYADVIVTPTTATGNIMGVCNNVVAIGAYCWLQTWGPCAVLINGTPGNGVDVVNGATTAGSVDVAAVAAEVNTRHLGTMMQIGVSTKYNSVLLKIRA